MSGINNVSQYSMQMMSQPAKPAAATKAPTAAPAGKPPAFDDLPGRISAIPNFEQYEDLIQRFISGESEMESAGKPLTEDQIALRGLMREYMRTDSRSISQVASDMQLASKNFMDYWFANGNNAPPPGRVLSPDGSFKIFNSKAEKDDFMKNQKLDFLNSMMAVIKANKNGGNGVDIKL